MARYTYRDIYGKARLGHGVTLQEATDALCELEEKLNKEVYKTNSVNYWLAKMPKISGRIVNDVYVEYRTYCYETGKRAVNKIEFSRQLVKFGYHSKVVNIGGKSFREYYLK